MLITSRLRGTRAVGPVGVVREAVRVDALEAAAAAAAAGALQAPVEAQPPAQELLRAHRDAARGPTGASSPTKIFARARSVAADQRQRRRRPCFRYSRGRLRGGLQEVAVVGLVPDREVAHRGQARRSGPSSAARPPSRSVPYSPALTFQLAVAKLRPRPPAVAQRGASPVIVRMTRMPERPRAQDRSS